MVCENKLWSALAGVFEAPQTMTNRAQKMKQVWTQFRLARVIQGDAQSFSAALEVPPIDGDLLFSKSHPVMRRWPGCKRTELPQEGAVGRASNRGTSMAAGTSVGTSARRNGTAAGVLLLIPVMDCNSQCSTSVAAMSVQCGLHQCCCTQE